MGFLTYFARYPSDRVTVIALSNNERGSSLKISNVLSAPFFGAEYEIPKERKAITVASSVLDRYVGEYEFQYSPTTFKITNENGKLTGRRSTEPKTEMFAESETKFFLRTEDIQFTFIKETNGAITGLIVDQGDGTLYEVMKWQKIR